MTQVPTLAVINPIWLKLFNRGWEDPNWGKRTIDQHTIAITIHELSALITDSTIRKEIQATSSKMLLATSQRLIKEAGEGGITSRQPAALGADSIRML